MSFSVCAFLQIFAKLNSFGKTLTVRREREIRNQRNGCFVTKLVLLTHLKISTSSKAITQL